MNIKESLEHIQKNYLNEKQKDFKNNKLNEFMVNELPEIMYNELNLDRDRYLVTGSCGKGNWATIPWIAIFDKTITTSATGGYYIVILFDAEMNGWYLSLNQGYTWYQENFKNKEAKKMINYMSQKLREQLNLDDSNIDLKTDTFLAKGYELGNIYSIYYQEESEDKIKEDIWNMLDLLYKTKIIIGDNWREYNINNLIVKNNTILEELRDYFNENKDVLLQSEERKNYQELSQEFQEEYPIEKFSELNLEEYVIGNNNKNTLSYKIEFGKYKHCGPGIGGGTAFKYGIFYSKDRDEYRSSENGSERNPEKQWEKIRKDLVSVINSVKNAQTVDDIKDDFKSLKSMSMFVIKLACLYVPDKILFVAGRKHLMSILEILKISYNEKYSSLQLAYLINKCIRENIPDMKNIDAWLMGNIVWNFYISKLKEKQDEISENKIWIYSPGEGARYWKECYKKGIMVLGWSQLGDLRNYNSKREIREALSVNKKDSMQNSVLANWEFANVVSIGDIIYAKKGMNTIIGKGIVESDYIYDENENEFKGYRKIKWINNEEKNIKEEFGIRLAQKTLTDITKYKDYVQKLNSLYCSDDIITINDNNYNKYDFLDEVLISEEKYDSIVNTLLRKKNIILQGPPGVGKTFCAKKIMYSLMNEKDDSKIKIVQFHQSYSYEDFIQGYRPNDEGKFELKNGIFYELVMDARKEYEKAKETNTEPKKYCMIIDEINRGNLSKVFGELMMLIESDKRDKKWSINLTYSDDEFYIPENLYIIGTMNTADRSLAMIDYALRRRFAFINLEPAFETEKLRSYLINKEKINANVVDSIMNNFVELNKFISSTLGDEFRIGHSYFIGQQLDSEDYENIYNDIIEFEIEPLLEEYYYSEDDENKVKECLEIINKL